MARHHAAVMHDKWAPELSRDAPSREAQHEPDESREATLNGREWQGDGIASALTRAPGPARATLLKSLARTHGNHFVQRLLAPPLQRLTVPAPGAGMGHPPNDPRDDSHMRLEPRAAYLVNNQKVSQANFFDGQVAFIALQPGTRGTLEFALRASVDIDNTAPFANIAYDKSYSVHWPVGVSPRGIVTVSDALPVVHGQGNGSESFQLYVESVDASKHDGYVQVRVKIASSTSRGRTNVLTPVGVGLEMNDSVAGRAWPPVDFQLFIPGSEATPTTTRIVAERDVDFGAGSSTLTASEADSLVEWYGGLPQDAQAAIRSGRGSIQLDGYASSTGRSADNVDLADRRNQAVMARLRAQAGGDRPFQNPPPQAHGEEPARQATGDQQEVADWRRVHIRILVADQPS